MDTNSQKAPDDKAQRLSSTHRSGQCDGASNASTRKTPTRCPRSVAGAYVPTTAFSCKITNSDLKKYSTRTVVVLIKYPSMVVALHEPGNTALSSLPSKLNKPVATYYNVKQENGARSSPDNHSVKAAPPALPLLLPPPSNKQSGRDGIKCTHVEDPTPPHAVMPSRDIMHVIKVYMKIYERSFTVC